MIFTPIKKILVVDDNEIMGHSIRRHMKREGFEVETTQNAATAVTMVLAAAEAGAPFHATIYALRLPDQRGMAFISWLNRTFPEIAVLAVSGFGNGDLIESLLRPERDCFRKTPVLPGEIITAIRCIETKQRQLREPAGPGHPADAMPLECK